MHAAGQYIELGGVVLQFATALLGSRKAWRRHRMHWRRRKEVKVAGEA